jgi:hypothetical protein
LATDTFAAFEAKYPELVAVSSMGKASKYKVDFWEQEREQMALLTRASEIAPGVWVSQQWQFEAPAQREHVDQVSDIKKTRSGVQCCCLLFGSVRPVCHAM